MRFGLKVLAVVGMALAILLPLAMIRSTIDGRQAYREEAVATVARSFAGEQRLAGPVLVVPFVETIEVEEKDEHGVTRTVHRERPGQWTIFPSTLDINGTLRPSTRRLGLHEVRVYELDAGIIAAFKGRVPDDGDASAPRRIGRPCLAWGIADVRGLAGSPRVRVDGRERALQQGLGCMKGTGIHVVLDPLKAGENIALETRLDLALGGTESLSIVPLGTENRVELTSTWPHPQFNGAFLPRERRIGDDGFRAIWDVSSLATDAQAQYQTGTGARDDDTAGSSSGESLDEIGLSLVEPVNVYSQTGRAIKYGVLFVVLTFAGFFMFELIRQLRIHPIQYLLVGLALAIFFLLLVALSEHIAFAWAYLSASVACIGLLGVYLAHVLRSRARGAGFAIMLATLYAALYGLLVSEDNALVLGAGLLFVILAAIMLVTRKVDWYRVAAGTPE